jgi:hypothetical protein
MVEEERYTRGLFPVGQKRTAIVSLFASTQMFCCPAWPGQKAALSGFHAGDEPPSRLGHGVVASHSGAYWIINTIVQVYFL